MIGEYAYKATTALRIAALRGVLVSEKTSFQVGRFVFFKFLFRWIYMRTSGCVGMCVCVDAFMSLRLPFPSFILFLPFPPLQSWCKSLSYGINRIESTNINKLNQHNAKIKQKNKINSNISHKASRSLRQTAISSINATERA